MSVQGGAGAAAGAGFGAGFGAGLEAALGAGAAGGAIFEAFGLAVGRAQESGLVEPVLNGLHLGSELGAQREGDAERGRALDRDGRAHGPGASDEARCDERSCC